MPKPSRPTICAVFAHITRRFKRLGLKGRPLVGLLFILLNVPLGWGGSILCVGLAHTTDCKWFYACATGIYALSWLMLFAGIALSGQEVYKRVNTIIPAAFKTRRRLK